MLRIIQESRKVFFTVPARFFIVLVQIVGKFAERWLRVCSFRRIQKRIFDPRFARFLGRKERETRNWICNLGNLPSTRAICTTASQKMTCFLLFDKLCDYTVQNLVVGSSNSDDGTYKADEERSALKLKIILRMSASLIQFHSSDFFYVARSNACCVYKRVCS